MNPPVLNSVLPDQKDRDLASFGLDTSWFVEAAAGTGKTSILVNRVCNLLIAGKAQVAEIVAITFTEKAAAELKERIHQQLDLLAVEAKKDELARIQTALSSMDEASISTIHAFCSQLLRERPIEAKIDPNFEISQEDIRDKLAAREAWRDWLRGLSPDDSEALSNIFKSGAKLIQVYDFAQKLNFDPERWARTEWINFDLSTFVEEFHIESERIRQLLETNGLNQNDAIYKNAKMYLENIDAARHLKPEEQLASLAASSGKALSRVVKKNWQDEDAAEEVKDWVNRCRAGFPFLHHGRILKLCDWLQSFVQSCRERRQLAGQLTFDELLLFARNLLRDDPETLRRFRKRFKYLLIDEFQDTDPLQTEIIWMLAGSGSAAKKWFELPVKPGKLFVVGDPKQSIYRFRGADIEIYEQARQTFKAKENLFLQTNFRSVNPLIQGVNSIFSRLIFKPEEGTYQPDYVELKPSPAASEKGGFTFLAPPDAVLEKFSTFNKEDANIVEAQLITDWINRFVKTPQLKITDKKTGELRPVKFGDVAILFRKMPNMAVYESWLRRASIPHHVVGSRTFYYAEVVHTLIHLLQAADQPFNKMAFVAALRTRVFACSDEAIFYCNETHGLHWPDLAKLDEENQNEILQPILRAAKLLERWQTYSRELKATLVIQKVIDESQIELLYVVRETPEQHRANLNKVLEIARQLEVRGLISLRRVIDYLAECKAIQVIEEESSVVEESEDVVHLLTMHKSKGLEYPIVILADMISGTQGSRSVDLQYNLSAGQRAVHLVNGIETSGYSELKAGEALRAAAEEIRLMYVAATRARDHLIIPWIVPENCMKKFGSRNEPIALLSSSGLNPLTISKENLAATELDFTSKIECKLTDGGNLSAVIFQPEKLAEFSPERPFYFYLLADQKPDAEVKEVLLQREVWLAQQEKFKLPENHSKRIITPSSLSHSESFERGNQPLDDEQILVVSVDNRSAMRIGSAVHEVLEHLDFKTLTNLDEVLSEAETTHDLDADESQATKEIIERTIGSEAFKRLRKADEIYREVPMCLQMDGALMEGIIDCLFREGEDWVVLDYKTDGIPAEGIAGLVDRYRAQLMAYARAVEIITGKHPKDVCLFVLKAEPPEIVSVV